MVERDDVIDATVVGSSLAVVQEAASAPPSLFGSADPVEIVERAVRVADALKAVVVAKKLISNIQGKEYPQVEAWLTLAAMLRLTTICEWSRRVEDGWEARVYVRNASGSTVGAAEAQCLATERSKRSWEDYALRSMAQTRATSKALRSVLGFVMVLAGYQATPAEEMPATDPPAKIAQTPREESPRRKREKRLFALMTECGYTNTTSRHELLKAITGRESFHDMTDDDLTKMLNHVTNPFESPDGQKAGGE